MELEIKESIIKVLFDELSKQHRNISFKDKYDVSGGFAFKSNTYTEEGTFVLRVTNINKDSTITTKDAKFFPSDKIDASLNKYLLKENDVLMVMVGGSIGKVGYVHKDVLPALLNQNMWRISSLEGNSCPRYIYYLIKYINGKKLKVTNSTHGHLSRNEYRETLIPNTGINTEKLVSRFLDKLFKENTVEDLPNELDTVKKKIEKLVNFQKYFYQLKKELQKQNLLLETFKTNILSEAIQGKLVQQNPNDEPASKLLTKINEKKEKLVQEKKIKKEKLLPQISDEEKLFELPRGWEWARFGRIATIASKLVNPSDFLDSYHIAPDNIEKGTGRLLNFRTVAQDGVTSPKHYFYEGHILYSKIRPNLSKVVLIDFQGLCSADMYPIKTYMDSKYLLNYMLSSVFLKQATKKDNRVKMPKINQADLNNILVPVPPLQEQKRIVEKVSSFMFLCGELEQTVEQSRHESEELLKAVLQEAFAKKE
ncbi:restriction endonuclease subunit S [Bacillus anthracis]|uniref:restriction endonuclease subunit S n=1 Tax=Bacillus anthracis TaxID=1392 RepID=UPI0018675B92|nr:restriction endonuclease subunit S [Bacillus anthracis]MBE3641228.1 restriction endonuclease subunit S [Bacillus anthracis]MDA2122462.1 restriction endonuclease subunit S [Bacillus cereus]